MPCNLNQRDLAVAVKEGIRAAGGTPMEFNTISVSDGVTMGTEGMKASLISREVVADSIELVSRGHLFDGLVCLIGCDKTGPGAAIAAGRLDIPTVILYSGTIMPGHHDGRDTDIVSIYEAIGAYRAGKIGARELYEIESTACPGAGACGGQYTANTMSMVLEFLGLSPAGLNGIPADRPRQAGRRSRRRASWSWTSCVAMCARHRSWTGEPSTTPSRRSPPPAAPPTACSTCWPSPTPSASRWTSTTSTPSPTGRPHRRPPAGRPATGPTSCTSRAVSGLVTRELLKRGPHRRRRADRRPARPCARSPRRRSRRPGQVVVKPIEQPIKATGGLAILHGSLAPDGCVIKLAGHERRYHRGPAKVYDSETECFQAVKRQEIHPGDVVVIRYEGPVGGPGHAGDAGGHRARSSARAWATPSGLLTDGRFSGGTHGLMIGHVAPEAAHGGPIAFVREGDMITIDVDKRVLDLEVDAAELERRKVGWTRPRRATPGASWPSTRRRSRPPARAPSPTSTCSRGGRDHPVGRRDVRIDSGPAGGSWLDARTRRPSRPSPADGRPRLVPCCFALLERPMPARRIVTPIDDKPKARRRPAVTWLASGTSSATRG